MGVASDILPIMVESEVFGFIGFFLGVERAVLPMWVADFGAGAKSLKIR